MSVRLNGAYPTRNNVGLVGRDLSSALGATPWVRNPSWPACEANAGDNKIVGLYAVYPGDGTGAGGNFFAVTISGAYTINYGDGTTTNYTSGSTTYYEFSYTDADLAGTDAPVTFTASTDTVNRTAHGYTDGMTVRFYNIVITTGLSENTPYYVVNSTANTFQVSATVGGSAIALTNDGSATLLPYKIATVTITPQAGQNLTSVNLFVKHNQSGLVNSYSTGWLDIAVAGASITTLAIGSAATTVRHMWLEQVKLNQLGAITSFAGLFGGCYALRNVVTASSITTVTNMSAMFSNCYALTSVPLFNTAAVTTMSNMFSGCTVLTSVPLFNTAAVTNMSNMFSTCYVLTSVPLFNTAAVTNMNYMFSGCNALTSVPLFNTAAVTDMSYMFRTCYMLTSVPLFNTAAVTNMSNMFFGCFKLTSVPLFNTAAVTNMSNMFNNCFMLTSVPLFNTAAVTDMNSMFRSCYTLISVPLFNTAAVTNMSNMFNTCYALTSVPALVTTAVTSSANFTAMFASCASLARIQAKDFKYTFSVFNCKLSAAALNEIYTNLPTVTGQTITVTGNYGTAADDPSIATAKGWTVTG